MKPGDFDELPAETQMLVITHDQLERKRNYKERIANLKWLCNILWDKENAAKRLNKLSREIDGKKRIPLGAAPTFPGAMNG